MSRNRTSHRAAAVFAAVVLAAAGDAHTAQRYQADDWIAECAGPPGSRSGECSITVPFWQSAENGNGSFALVVMPQTGEVGLVGSPTPARAELRVDKNPAVVCRGQRYCIFPPAQSIALLRELDNASLILIDVFTQKSRFSFSLSPKGYRAGMAQIRAWGYPLGVD